MSQACVALLAQQGLRPTTAGGRYAVEEVIRAQFGPALRAFGGLRRRRNELEYPLYPTEQATLEEAAEALVTAAELIDAAAKLVPKPRVLLTATAARRARMALMLGQLGSSVAAADDFQRPESRH